MCQKRPGSIKPSSQESDDGDGGVAYSSSSSSTSTTTSSTSITNMIGTSDPLEAFPIEVVFLVEMCLPVQSLIGK